MLTSELTVHMLKCIVRGHVCCPIIYVSSFILSFIHSFIHSFIIIGPLQVGIHAVQNRLLFSSMAVLYHVNGYLQRAHYHHHYNGICIEHHHHHHRHHHHHHHHHHPNLCDLYHYLLTRVNMKMIKIIIIFTIIAFIFSEVVCPYLLTTVISCFLSRYW